MTEIYSNDKSDTMPVTYLFWFFFGITIPGKLLLDLILYSQLQTSINLSFASAIIAIPVFVLILLKKGINIFDELSIIAALATIICIVYGIFVVGGTISNDILINYISASIVLYIIYFLIGCVYRFNQPFITTICSSVLFLSVLYIFLFQFVLAKSLWASLNENGSYLRIADLFAVNALICYFSMKRNLMYKLLILTISCIALLYLGSRSSLGMFVLTVVTTETFYFKFNLKKNMLMLSGILLVILNINSINALLDDFIYKYSFTDIRIISTLIDSSDYGGLAGRTEFFERGLKRIDENPLLGKFLGDVIEFGVPGKYIHNILFLWDEFGLLPFVCVILLILVSVIEIFKNRDNYDFSKEVVAIFIFSIVSMVFARAFQFPYLFFSIGYLSGKFKNEFKI